MVIASGTALGQRRDDVWDDGWQGDEPNVQSPGTIPYGRGDPSASYPADDNGMSTALAGDPSRVLGVKFIYRYSIPTVGTAYPLDGAGLLSSLGAGNMLVPGAGHFRGWFGTWTDLNGNAYIENVETPSAAHVSTRGGCTASEGTDVAGLTRVRTDDPNGATPTVAGTQIITTPVSARCFGGDEWVAGDTSIVLYVTPGRRADDVNRAFGARGGEAPAPDYTMTGLGQGTGRYYTPTSNFDMIIVDNSILETTVVEAISAPKAVSGGARDFERDSANPDSLVDVDLYSSIDPTAEAAYQTNVINTMRSIGGEDCQAEYPEDCPVGHATQAYYDSADDTYATVGPNYAQVFPRMEVEDTGFDYKTGPHVYFDLQMQHAASTSGVGTHLNYPIGYVSAKGDGQVHALGQMQVFGVLGVWNDLNADGFIGDAIDPIPPCMDEYQCGAVQDPNCPAYYGIGAIPTIDVRCGYESAESAGEWVGTCGPKNPLSAVASSLNATLESSTGDWGPTGVYVLTDRKTTAHLTNPSSTADPYRTGGRNPFNPYDDLLVDASDGSVDSIVFSGPIPFHVQCTGGGGYYSYERFWFPTGNLGFDVIMRSSVTAQFDSLGVTVPETVDEVDVYAQL